MPDVSYPISKTFSYCVLLSLVFLGLLYGVLYRSARRAPIESRIALQPPLKADIRIAPINFRPESTGVVVFLHIQKTGGSDFGRKLLRFDVGRPCEKMTDSRKRSNCFRPGSDKESWLFSRYTIGWPCAVHADWTELHECVEKTLDRTEGKKGRGRRRFFYVTMLRDPVRRFVSEYAHVKRGATWVTRHHCGGQPVTSKQLPECYAGFSEKKPWPRLTMDKFLACESNLAINRQTRMLADLTLVGCYSNKYSKTKRERMMLESAKANLKSMAFVGLTEYQAESQALFEHVFNFKFSIQFETEQQSKSRADYERLGDVVRKRITEVNWMDVELYSFARTLFLERHRALTNGSMRVKSEWTQFLLAGDKEAMNKDDDSIEEN
ncbi:heparan-sulfate 6-O-sulfotransferase 3-B-like [Oscarella lobularis]|uniref:heparan-sulfate 6-O-sulfotransferase 3-B-like n=1 Tax=Oscarella lobularis TaxID=121494 RepID=UPI0033141C7E